jgi:PAS domain S-box-containing protein
MPVYREFFLTFPLPVLVFERNGEKFLLTDFNPVSKQTLNHIFNLTFKQDAEEVFSDVPDIVQDLDRCLSRQKKLYRDIFQPDEKESEKRDPLKLTFVNSGPKTVFIIIRDITALKNAEMALRENRERLELAINATDSGLWDWDIPTGELIFNDLWYSILGYKPGELDFTYNAWEELVHPNDKERVLEQLNEHLAGKTKIYQTEYRLLAKDGNWKWVLDTGRVTDWHKNGTPFRAIGTIMNITKRKQLEKELKLLNTHLEDLVEKRTKKLNQKKQALLKSQEAEEEKSKHLEEVNNALKVLIKKSAENKRDVEKNIASNINDLVMPYLEKMDGSIGAQQKTLVKIIRSNLEEITSSFSLKLTSKSISLTPSELRVANMIKHGNSTKDIAELLLLSPRTIETQRRMIRKKFGLIGKNINLETYLQHLQ